MCPPHPHPGALDSADAWKGHGPRGQHVSGVRGVRAGPRQDLRDTRASPGVEAQGVGGTGEGAATPEDPPDPDAGAPLPLLSRGRPPPADQRHPSLAPPVLRHSWGLSKPTGGAPGPGSPAELNSGCPRPLLQPRRAPAPRADWPPDVLPWELAPRAGRGLHPAAPLLSRSLYTSAAVPARPSPFAQRRASSPYPHAEAQDPQGRLSVWRPGHCARERRLTGGRAGVVPGGSRARCLPRAAAYPWGPSAAARTRGGGRCPGKARLSGDKPRQVCVHTSAPAHTCSDQQAPLGGPKDARVKSV